MIENNKNSYALPFAAWELRLYLDTHPHDREALAQFKALCEASGSKCNYACHTAERRPIVRESGCGCGDTRNMRTAPNCGRRNDCGCGTRQIENVGSGCGCDTCEGDSAGVWSWIEGPWPWEPEANVTGGNC